MGALAQTVGISSAQSGLWERYVRPPHPDHSNPRWHVSPLIDLAAYHFSWAWALVPMMLLGTWDSAIYCVYALVMGANLAHRHYGLPYAYFDGGVFRTFERKLTLFPQICILMLAATPLSLSQRAGWIGAGAVGAVVFFSLLWNFWHVYMQKYGILRLYQAKDPAPVQRQGPAWVDKYFILCWIPLYLSYLVPKYKDLILANGTNVAGPLSAIIGFMEKYERWLRPPPLSPRAVLLCGFGGNGAPTDTKTARVFAQPPARCSFPRRCSGPIRWKYISLSDSAMPSSTWSLSGPFSAAATAARGQRPL
jgi:hypothetical protein